MPDSWCGVSHRRTVQVGTQQRQQLVDLACALVVDVDVAAGRVLDVLPVLELDVGETQRGDALVEGTLGCGGDRAPGA